MANWNLPPGNTDAMVDEAMGADHPQCGVCNLYLDAGDLRKWEGHWYCEKCHPRRCHAPECKGWGEFTCDPCGETFCSEHVASGTAFGLETLACFGCRSEAWE